jgi:hypothetical protein
MILLLSLKSLVLQKYQGVDMALVTTHCKLKKTIAAQRKYQIYQEDAPALLEFD